MSKYAELGPDERRNALNDAVVYFSQTDPQALLDFEAKHRAGGCACVDAASEPEEAPEAPEAPKAPEVVEEGAGTEEAPEAAEAAAGDAEEEAPAPTVDWSALNGNTAKAAMKDASEADLKAALEDTREGVSKAAQAELDSRG